LTQYSPTSVPIYRLKAGDPPSKLNSELTSIASDTAALYASHSSNVTNVTALQTLTTDLTRNVTAGTTLIRERWSPVASATTGSITQHKLFVIGDYTGNTSYGMGDPNKQTAGLMASFGRTAAATASAFSGTDTAIDARMINTQSNNASYDMQGIYIKTKNYSGGVVGVMKGAYIEAVNEGTATTVTGLDLGSDGSTLSVGIDMNSIAAATKHIRFPGGNMVNFASAAPTATTSANLQGDVVFNTGATASGTVGWVCVSAGSPGTWKTFGAVTA